MNSVIICFFASIISTIFAKGTQGQGLELELVHLIWRHGDRSPIKSYPTDPFANDVSFPEGFGGQLTKIGEREGMGLGRYLRDRYKGFIKEEYDPEEIIVTSSETNRTVRMAQLVLEGLYNLTALDDMTLVQIPHVTVIPKPVDNIILSETNCTGVEIHTRNCDKWLTKELSSPTSDWPLESVQWTQDYLANHTGRVITSFFDLSDFIDALQIEKLKNLPLPEWTVKLPWDEFAWFQKVRFTTLTCSDELKKLLAGPLLKEMLGHIENSRSRSMEILDSKLGKVFAYSGHDTTISAIFNSLQSDFLVHPPSYAALVILELKKEPSTGKRFLDILYRNETTRDPYSVHVPGCESPSCELTTFRKLVSRFIPLDWEQECNLSSVVGEQFVKSKHV